MHCGAVQKLPCGIPKVLWSTYQQRLEHSQYWSVFQQHWSWLAKEERSQSGLPFQPAATGQDGWVSAHT